MFTLKEITLEGIKIVGTFDTYQEAFKASRKQAGTFCVETMTEFGKHTYWC